MFLSNNAIKAELCAILCAETCADGAVCPLQQAMQQCGVHRGTVRNSIPSACNFWKGPAEDFQQSRYDCSSHICRFRPIVGQKLRSNKPGYMQSSVPLALHVQTNTPLMPKLFFFGIFLFIFKFPSLKNDSTSIPPPRPIESKYKPVSLMEGGYALMC